MTDGAELILSKSSIEVFLRCAYRWYLGYALRIKAAPNLDMAVGTAVHAGVEAMWHGMNPEPVLRDALLREMRLASVSDNETAAAAVVDALAMLRVYALNIAPTFTPTMVERDFLIRVDGVLVSGRIDAADGDVHDTKTTSTPSKVDPEQHRLGMTMYRWGFRALAGSFPGRLLLDVVARNGRWAVKPVEPDDQGMADAIGLVASQVNAGRFEPTGALNGACHRCAYATLCPYVKLD